MFKNGDKLIAKTRFLTRYEIPFEKRNLVVKYDGETETLLFNGEEIIRGSGLLSPENFFLPNSVNYEVSKLIEDDNIEFKSFSGVTMDGKVIQIDSTH